MKLGLTWSFSSGTPAARNLPLANPVSAMIASTSRCQTRRLMHDRPRSREILSTIRDHLMKANDAMIDHLQRCRRGAEAGSV